VGFAMSPLTPYASARHFLGAELRHHRLTAGLSLTALASRVLVAPTLLGKIEAATRYPNSDLVERCDEVLGCGGALVRLHGLVEAERQARSASPAADPAQLLAQLLDSIGRVATPSLANSANRVLNHIDNVLHATDEVKRRNAASGSLARQTRP